MEDRGSFDEECGHPTQFTAWVLLPHMSTPVPFDTVAEALEVIALEQWYAAEGPPDRG